jgi:RNA:NAD 2'-phosphotransferase (TPT1/KptA family)
MCDLLARIAVTSQQALCAHAKKYGVTVTPAMVDEVVISAKRQAFTNASIRSIYGHIQWRSQKVIQESADRKSLISNMLASMANANDAFLLTLQAG